MPHLMLQRLTTTAWLHAVLLTGANITASMWMPLKAKLCGGLLGLGATGRQYAYIAWEHNAGTMPGSPMAVLYTVQCL
jgi:hypothetical protein